MKFQTYQHLYYILNNSKVRQVASIVLLGVSFLFIFSGFSTLENLQKTFLVSIHDENPDFIGDDNTSLGILYTFFAIIGFCFAPFIISITGPVLAMMIGATGYVLYPILFMLESTSYLYLGKVISGLGSSLLWTGQANYLIKNSQPGMISKNLGLFWIFYMMGILPSTLIACFTFEVHVSNIHVDKQTRNYILYLLSHMIAFGICIMIFLRRSRKITNIEEENKSIILKSEPVRGIKNALRLTVTKELLLLLIPFCYTGLQMTFFSGIYLSSARYKVVMGESSKELVPFSGIFICFGEITGGMLPFNFNGKKCWEKNLIMVTGLISNIFCCILTYLSTGVGFVHNTFELIQLNENLAGVCSFLMGLGDCCVHIELYTVLGTRYPNQSTELFAIFQCIRYFITSLNVFCTTMSGIIIIFIVQSIYTTFYFHYLQMKNSPQTVQIYHIQNNFNEELKQPLVTEEQCPSVNEEYIRSLTEEHMKCPTVTVNSTIYNYNELEKDIEINDMKESNHVTQNSLEDDNIAEHFFGVTQNLHIENFIYK